MIGRDEKKKKLYNWMERELKYTYRYYYNDASDNVKRCYDAFVRALISVEPSCRMPVMDMAVCQKAYRFCLLDNPLLFYTDHINITMSIMGIVVEIEYIMDFDEIYAGIKKISKTMRLVRDKCEGKTTYKKERMIHDAVVRSVKYDKDAKYPIHTAYSAIVNRKAVCDGISKMTKILLDAVGVESVVITGTAMNNGHSGRIYTSDSGHAWNMVKIGGEYYHLDVTFDHGLSDGDNICYDYYNLSNEQILKDHKFDL